MDWLQMFALVAIGVAVLLSWVSFLGGIGQGMIEDEKKKEEVNKPTVWGRGKDS